MKIIKQSWESPDNHYQNQAHNLPLKTQDPIFWKHMSNQFHLCFSSTPANELITFSFLDIIRNISPHSMWLIDLSQKSPKLSVQTLRVTTSQEPKSFLKWQSLVMINWISFPPMFSLPNIMIVVKIRKTYALLLTLYMRIVPCGHSWFGCQLGSNQGTASHK